MLKTGYIKATDKSYDKTFDELLKEWKSSPTKGWTWSKKDYDENRVIRACKAAGYDIAECCINWLLSSGDTRMVVVSKNFLSEEDCAKIKSIASETIKQSMSYANGKFKGLFILSSRKADKKFYYREVLSTEEGKTLKEMRHEAAVERREARKAAYAEAKKKDPSLGKRAPTSKQVIKDFLIKEGFEDVKASAGEVSCTYVTFEEIQDMEEYTKSILRKLFALRLNKTIRVNVGSGRSGLFYDNGTNIPDPVFEYPLTVKIYNRAY